MDQNMKTRAKAGRYATPESLYSENLITSFSKGTLKMENQSHGKCYNCNNLILNA